MKKLFYILLLCFSPLFVFSQEYWDEFEEGENQPRLERDSLPPQSDVEHQKVTWQWRREGVYREFIPIDTTIDGIHNYNPIFKKSIANTYLANLPSPYESAIFIERAKEQDFYFFTPIRAYLFKPEDALEFNTTTPFTQLNYFTGGQKGLAENFLDVWHSQNIKPYWNAGFRYNLISSDGRYMNQKSKAYNLSLFSSYEKDKWAVSFFLNQNNGNFQENGGITEKYYLTDTTMNSEDIPVRLSDSKNTYINFNFYTLLQYNLGNKKYILHEEDTVSYSYPAKVTFSINIEDNERRFKERVVERTFYPLSYIDSISNVDYMANNKYEFSTKLIVNEHPKYTYLPGIYAGLDFKQLNYEDRTSLNPTDFRTTSKYYGTWLTAGIFNVDTNAVLTYDVGAKLGILGDYAGNFSVDGYVRQYLTRNRMSYVQAEASIESKNANHYFLNYLGNHDYWHNNFSNIKKFDVRGKYINEKWGTEAGVGWSNYIDYIYTDYYALPQQSSKALIILTAWVKQRVKLGHFHFDQNVYFQKSNHEDIVSLPLISVYSHNYYQNSFFKNALDIAIGFDFSYNTKFYGDSYAPSTMLFYNQRVEKTGNYPKLDVFLNFGIKRATLFVKYEHLNYYFSNGEYYSALYYPINPAMFKFGLKWNFFD